MTLNQAIIIVAAMYTALVAYSVWRLFFSKQSKIEKCNIMSNQKIYASTDESKRELKEKYESLLLQREAIMAELIDNYSEPLLRELNICDHHITVTHQRLEGQWLSEPMITLPKTQLT